MTDFRDSYPSVYTPENLWRVINTPLLDPDIASLIHEDMEVSYAVLGHDGQIESGTTITYVATDEAIQKVPPVYRRFIPKDVEFFVTQMSPRYEVGQEILRHDVLLSDKADGSITRTVKPEEEGSRLVVEATLTLNGLEGIFDNQIKRALKHIVGDPSERTVVLAQDILDMHQ